MTQITTISPIQIKTVLTAVPSSVGLTGVAVLNPASTANLHSYHTLNEVVRDFEPNSDIYNKASIYFQGNGGLFQVIDYPTASAASASGIQTFTPSNGSSSGSSNSSSTASSAAANTSSATDADGAITALTKYYYAGWEYLSVQATDSNHDFITQIAKLVNDQNRKIMVVDIPTANDTPDFSWTAPFAEYSSVFTVSSLKADSNNFGLALLAAFCTTSPSGNIMYVPSLEQSPYNVTPQTRFEFGDYQLEKYYAPYHVATLAYTLPGATGLTDNHVSNVMQFSTPRVRDYISDRIQTELSTILAKNWQNGVPYDANGINLIQKTISMILQDCVNKGYIGSFDLHQIDADSISDYKKASGELQLPGYEWTPLNNINKITIVQDIIVPSAA